MAEVTGIRCHKCKDEVWSRTRHDFRECSCGKVAIDGGSAYTRISGDPNNYTIITITTTEVQRSEP